MINPIICLLFQYFTQIRWSGWKISTLRVNAEEPKVYKCQHWQEQEGDWRGRLAPGAEDWLLSNTVSNKPNSIPPDSLIVLSERVLLNHKHMCMHAYSTVMHTVHTCHNCCGTILHKKQRPRKGKIGKSCVQWFFLFWCFLKQTLATSVSRQAQQHIIYIYWKHIMQIYINVI